MQTEQEGRRGGREDNIRIKIQRGCMRFTGTVEKNCFSARQYAYVDSAINKKTFPSEPGPFDLELERSPPTWCPSISIGRNLFLSNPPKRYLAAKKKESSLESSQPPNIDRKIKTIDGKMRKKTVPRKRTADRIEFLLDSTLVRGLLPFLGHRLWCWLT